MLGTRQGIPCKGDLDVILVNRESEVQQLQLSVVTIQQVTTGSAILPSASHVLPKAVEGRAFLTVALGILAICLPDVLLEGLDPIDFVCLLQRAREHRRLNHCGMAVRSGMLPSKNHCAIWGSARVRVLGGGVQRRVEGNGDRSCGARLAERSA